MATWKRKGLDPPWAPRSAAAVAVAVAVVVAHDAGTARLTTNGKQSSDVLSLTRPSWCKCCCWRWRW